jgi:hypothetical protein
MFLSGRYSEMNFHLQWSSSFYAGTGLNPNPNSLKKREYNEDIMGKYGDKFRNKFEVDLEVATSKRKQADANRNAVSSGFGEFFKELTQATNRAVADIRGVDNFLQFVTPGLRETSPAFSVVYNRDHEERTAKVTLKASTHEVLLKLSSSPKQEQKFKIESRNEKLQLVEGEQIYSLDEFIDMIFSSLLQISTDASLKVWESLAS